MKKLIIIIFLFISILPAYAGYYSNGLNSYTHKNYEKAKEYFLKTLEHNENNGNAHYFLGEIAKQEGKYQEAEEHFAQAVSKRIDKKFVKLAYWNLIVLAEQKNDLAATIKACKEFWQHTHDDSAKNKAETIINKMLWTENKNAIALYQKGQTLQKKGKVEEAIQEFYNALQEDPSFLAPRVEIGLIMNKQNNIQGAMSNLQTIADKIPYHSTINLLLGDLFMKNKSYAYATTYFTNALEFGFFKRSRQYRIYVKRGTCNYKLNNFEAAETDIKNALSIKRKGKEPLFLLSAIYIKNENYPEAIKILKRLNSVTQKNQEVIFQIGTIYYKQRDNSFVTYFEKLFSLTVKEIDEAPSKYIKAFTILAKYHFSIKSFLKASEILSKIPEKYRNYEINLMTAKTYFHLHKFPQAIDYFEKLSLSSDDSLILCKAYILSGYSDKGKILLSNTMKSSLLVKEKALQDKILQPYAAQIEKENQSIAPVQNAPVEVETTQIQNQKNTKDEEIAPKTSGEKKAPEQTLQEIQDSSQKKNTTTSTQEN